MKNLSLLGFRSIMAPNHAHDLTSHGVNFIDYLVIRPNDYLPER